MDQAQEKNLVLPWTRKDFVSNGLVLIVPTDAKRPIQTLEDLKMREVARISLGNPETVPAGRYAKEVLTNDGLWEKLLPKFIFGNTVRQVLDYVSRGEVDAGFVFSTDAIQMKDKVRIRPDLRKAQANPIPHCSRCREPEEGIVPKVC